MVRSLEGLPEPPPLPPGLRLRALTPEDATRYAELLQANAELGNWDLARVQKMTENDVPFSEIFVIEDEAGRFLSTACVGPAHADYPFGTVALGWVASHPEARGRGLGSAVCVAAMRRARERGASGMMLLTDDWRLPALRLYLKLGFSPDRRANPSFRERWEELLAGSLSDK